MIKVTQGDTTQLNARYEVFCELKAEPTTLSGAGRVTLLELNRALDMKGLPFVSEEGLLKLEEEFEREYLHILY